MHLITTVLRRLRKQASPSLLRLRSTERLCFKVPLLYACVFWYASSGFLYFEGASKSELSWQDAMWWSFVTMTTVGYGDLFPESFGGRYLVAVPTMVIGIGILGFIISEISAKLVESRSKRTKGLIRVTMEQHILIVHFSGLELLRKVIFELRADPSTEKLPICVVDDRLEELPMELSKLGLEFVRGNPTQTETMERANLAKACHALVLTRNPSEAHSDDTSLAAVLLIKRMRPDIGVVGEVLDPEKKDSLMMAGASSVVCTAELRGNLLIQELQDPGVKAVIADLTSNCGGEQIYMVPLEGWAEQNYNDLALTCLQSGLALVGVIRGSEHLLAPEPSMPLKSIKKAILVGRERPDALHYKAGAPAS